MKTYIEESQEIHFYHVCTDGTNNGVVFFCEDDYRQAITISALVALACGVTIICYVHMSTHSHFLIACTSPEKAAEFGRMFKARYSRYVHLTHGESHVYRLIGCKPIPVEDIFYLKNCISYILLNPVEAGIVKYAEIYPWSSFNAYFNPAPIEGRPISSLSIREQRRLLKTKQNLSETRLVVTESGEVALKSFIEYALVEDLFKTKANFYRSLSMTDSSREEERYAAHSFSYSDTEVIASMVSYSIKLFGKDNLLMLTKEEKHKLIHVVHRIKRFKARQMARTLRLATQEVEAILGI